MDCKYMIKVPPLIKIYDDEDFWVLYGYHKWLNENNIDRYRGGTFPRDSSKYRGEDVGFRFEAQEDAMAFKLVWI